MLRLLYIIILVLIPISNSFSGEIMPKELAQFLQDISVTINADKSQGSGVIITREVDGRKTNFVWTAGHVVAHLRSVRTVIDPLTGTSRQLVEFKNASIVKELVEDGRRVGELKMDAKVIRYSSADTGHDLALLEIRKKDFINNSANFYLNDDISAIGTKLVHVGSLLGQLGSNSMTGGLISQIGRTLDDKIFDQTTVTAFPGSSGGGVFLDIDSKEHAGQYIGMLVRGAGETFNLIVPVRRMRSWASSAGIEWAIDSSKPMPPASVLSRMPIEDIGVIFHVSSTEKRPSDIARGIFQRPRNPTPRIFKTYEKQF